MAPARRRAFTLAGALVLAVGAFSVTLRAQPERSVWDGVYTEAQASRGAILYDKECGQCHGPAGAGGSMAPALVGPAFSANYDGQTVGDLFDRNRTTMPPGKEGQISPEANAEITAYMLKVNQFPAGPSDLPSQGMALKAIQYLAQKPHSQVRQDPTPGHEWIKRLERPERLPALKIDAVIAALGLKPGMMIADIGCGTGAFTIPFAKAVAPTGTAFAVDIWPELLTYVRGKADAQQVGTLQTVLAQRDDPALGDRRLDIAFFHDVFHNVDDRLGYLRKLASYLKPDGRIAIVEQEFDDPIAQKWDKPEDRITREQVGEWMATTGFTLEREIDLFTGANNPPGAGMPQRWFVIYRRSGGPPPTP